MIAVETTARERLLRVCGAGQHNWIKAIKGRTICDNVLKDVKRYMAWRAKQVAQTGVGEEEEYEDGDLLEVLASQLDDAKFHAPTGAGKKKRKGRREVCAVHCAPWCPAAYATPGR